MSVTIEGLARITKRLQNMSSGAGMRKKMGQACALVEGAARQKAPKKTGDLRRHMESRVLDRGAEIVGEVYNNLEYAPYAEYGTGLFAEGGNGRKDVPWFYEDEKTGETIATSGQRPQPYLRPALHENRKAITKKLMEGLQNG